MFVDEGRGDASKERPINVRRRDKKSLFSNMEMVMIIMVVVVVAVESYHLSEQQTTVIYTKVSIITLPKHFRRAAVSPRQSSDACAAHVFAKIDATGAELRSVCQRSAMPKEVRGRGRGSARNRFCRFFSR